MVSRMVYLSAMTRDWPGIGKSLRSTGVDPPWGSRGASARAKRQRGHDAPGDMGAPHTGHLEAPLIPLSPNATVPLMLQVNFLPAVSGNTAVPHANPHQAPRFPGVPPR